MHFRREGNCQGKPVGGMLRTAPKRVSIFDLTVSATQ